MLNKKLFILSILITVIFGNLFADNNINFTLEINGVSVNDGQLHIKVYSNDRDYKNDNHYRYYIIESTSSIINYIFSIPEGEYLIIIFQDTNKNGTLDTNFLGIPKEPSGISNYSGGIPIGWNRHKFLINNSSNRLMIRIGKA